MDVWPCRMCCPLTTAVPCCAWLLNWVAGCEANAQTQQHVRFGWNIHEPQVQCGLGRTGKLWGHQLFGVEPDMMTLAKPLAGGLPIGAVLLKQHVADVMKPGGWAGG